jgi:hypothetical protein
MVAHLDELRRRRVRPSIYAYLRQIPPIKNKVPDPIPPAK